MSAQPRDEKAQARADCWRRAAVIFMAFLAGTYGLVIAAGLIGLLEACF